MTASRMQVQRLAVAAVLVALAGATSLQAQQVPEPALTRLDIGGEGARLSNAAISPDGRWIAVDREEGTNRSSLWIAPAAGGDLVRLTDAGYLDEAPVWSPDGTRIFFTSTRPARGTPGYFIMSLRIDPQTGRALDAPRQITVERESRDAVPSPDGTQLLYRTGTQLRVAPANGGNSRVVTRDAPAQIWRYTWSADGTAIYYVAPNPARGGPYLFRVPAAGGTPTEVFSVTGRNVQAILPATQRVVAWVNGPGQRQRTYEILDFEGRVVARRLLSTDFSRGAVSSDGRRLILVSSDIGAVMRVRPVAGGDPIDLTDGKGYGWPVAWTADSRSVVVHDDKDGVPTTFLLPLAGGARREVALPAEHSSAQLDWGTPTHLAYRLPRDDGSYTLVAMDLATGVRSLLSEQARQAPLVGPGGLYRDADGFYFAERHGDRVEIRSAAPGRNARTVFSAPVGFFAQRSGAFQGQRFAYTELVGDSVGVMMVDAPGAPPRLLMTIGVPRPQQQCCRTSLAFSHDGQWLAVDPFGGEPNVGRVVVARVPAQGRATDVRTIAVEAEYWYEARWAPDNSGFTVIAGEGMHAWVAWVPTAPGERVRHLSRGEGATWGNELSPDGRYVVYPSEVWRGSTIWALDLR